jgi:Tfp pilus assembly protein PilV
MKKYEKSKKGVGIIEAIVAIMVFTIGLIGVSRLMGVSVKSSQNSYADGTLALLSEDATERLNMLGGTSSLGSIAIGGFLDNANCAPTDAACIVGITQRREWNASLQNALPGNNVSTNVVRNANGQILLSITYTPRVINGDINANNPQTNGAGSPITYSTLVDV